MYLLPQLPCWLLISRPLDGRTYGEFIAEAPSWNPRAELITGKVCGVQVETIENPLEKRMRQLDKLADELAKGRPMEKVLRS